MKPVRRYNVSRQLFFFVIVIIISPLIRNTFLIENITRNTMVINNKNSLRRGQLSKVDLNILLHLLQQKCVNCFLLKLGLKFFYENDSPSQKSQNSPKVDVPQFCKIYEKIVEQVYIFSIQKFQPNQKFVGKFVFKSGWFVKE